MVPILNSSPLEFKIFFPNKFVVSSCFLQIRTISPQNMAIFGERNSRNTICKICTRICFEAMVQESCQK
jgi:hypothetical protein